MPLDPRVGFSLSLLLLSSLANAQNSSAGHASVLEASAGTDEYSTVDTRQLVHYLMNLEQVSVTTANCRPIMLAHLDRELIRVGSQLVARFQKEAGVQVVDRPSNGGWSMDEISNWVSTLRSSNPEKRCEMIKLAHAVAVFRLSQMKASASRPSVVSEAIAKSDPHFEKDLDIVKWEYRYFLMTPVLNRIKSSCKDDIYPAHELSAEIMLRLEYIQNGFVVDGKRHFKWPLGRAEQMCGRPMSTHYVDHLSFEEQQKQNRPFPEGLQCAAAQTERELDQCLGNLRKRSFDLAGPRPFKK